MPHSTLPQLHRRHAASRTPPLLAAAFCVPVLAQAGELAARPEATLTPIQVVAKTPVPGLGIERDLLPYPVQTASADALRQAQAGNLIDFLATNLTGVNVNEVQGSPFQNDITFRGFRASPILGSAQGLSAYLDGVRVNEPFGDVVNWDMLPEAAIADLTLVPGSNPLYGFNTLGGALAFTTKSGRSHPGMDAEISYGSNARKRIDAGYGARFDNGLHAFVATTLFDENGWREHSAGRMGNLFAKVGRDSGQTQWHVSALHGDSKLIGNGLLPSYRWADGTLANGLYENDRRAAYTHPDQTSNRLQQAAFNLRHWINDDTELSTLAYVRRSRRDTLNGDVNGDYEEYVEDCEDGFNPDGSAVEPDDCGFTAAQGAAQHNAVLNRTHTRQTSAGLALNLSRQTEHHQFAVGASFDQSRVSFAQTRQDAWFDAGRGVQPDVLAAEVASSSVTGNSQAFGLYATDTWKLATATHLTASARWNHARVSNTLTGQNGVQPKETFNYSKLNPAIGLTHKLAPGLTVFGGVAQSNRVPTVIELGCADPLQACVLPTGLQSDPYLKQVVSRTVEAGMRWQAGGAALSASLYRAINRDDILFLRAGSSQLGYFANFDRTRHQGLDLAASKEWKTLALRMNYSLLDATYDASGRLFAGERTINVLPGMPIAGLPRHTLKLALDWKPAPAWLLGGEMVAVSSLTTQGNEDGLRADPAPGVTPQTADWRIRGHAVFNLRGSYRSGKQLELFARVQNVFNRRYETYGAIGADLFPNGQLLQPHVAAQDAGDARFVAPGAPRSFTVGMRYRF
ncbi:TonB-dependent receptor [Noviherbaspirillum sedimenti]|uniref:TonB-dependent receptor n=2 Tax=Noviherbaspirillum sedimenti TaxID=2320865 RepID=A0A3A3FVS4_9BURK|nr:TonB-dependent receptor [Noviherbaspirillum sedimenti]RJG00298.1 TonB-dependent receptor [Noviherbaspirillum sedimenti]